ncbi:hypothetical protein ABZ215_02690 [Amycolatopsis sp. NPDC006131]|uniref:hypothetical protein n=1 Tax=Amycolatopsis sp. NPDC006131 TaxID=3156731 RepID=UPI0033B26BB8
MAYGTITACQTAVYIALTAFVLNLAIAAVLTPLFERGDVQGRRRMTGAGRAGVAWPRGTPCPSTRSPPRASPVTRAASADKGTKLMDGCAQALADLLDGGLWKETHAAR